MGARLRRAAVEHLVFDGQSFCHVPLPTLPQIVTALLKPHSWAVVGISSTTYATRTATAASRTDRHVVNGSRQVLVDIGGQSDLLGGLTAAQILSAAESYADGRRTAGFDLIVGCTVPPIQQTTGVWGTYTAAMETQRVAYNPLLKASSHFDAVADIAAIVQLADPSDTTYFSDGLHPTLAGANPIGAVIVAALASVGIT